MKLPACLPFAALVFLTPSALACWSCDGTTDADCRARIEESRHRTAEQIAKNGADACKGKEAGIQPMHFGLSTAGSFAHVCDGKGGGCLHWINDDMGQARNKFYPLGGVGSCETAMAIQAENHNKPARDESSPDPEDYVTTDEKGYRVVLLDDSRARERKKARSPASEDEGTPIFPLGAMEKIAP